jgi:hypothetical protein
MVCEIEEDITPIFQPFRKMGQLQDKEKNASVITTTSRPALGPTQPPIQGVPEALAVGVKRLGRGAIPPLPQYAFIACCSLKKG